MISQIESDIISGSVVYIYIFGRIWNATNARVDVKWIIYM